MATKNWALPLSFLLLAQALGAQAPSDDSRPVSWRRMFPNIASDQKSIWTSPVRVAKDHHWVPVVGVLAVTAGLIASDPNTGAYFRRTNSFHGFNSVVSGNTASMGIIVAPLTLYAAGLLRKDSYQSHTALLAGEAVADAEILTTIFKDADRRVRPAAIPPGGNFRDTWFDSQGSFLRGNGSFPSGHTIAAFSIATVISRRYGKRHRWMPYAAYGLATLVGFSRISASAHFPSDVFMGAALGYAISRFAVLRQ